MKNNRLKKVCNSFGLKFTFVLLLTILISGTVTYGYFVGTRSQRGKNTVASACFNVEFTDGESINLTNAVSVGDAVGGASDPYTFTLSNTCELDAFYYVILDVKTGSFDNSHINYSIDKGTPVTLSKATLNTTYKENDTSYGDSYIVGTGSLNNGDTKQVEFRAWINSETTYDDVKGQTWEGQVRVINVVKAVNSGINGIIASAKTGTPDFTQISPPTSGEDDSGVYAMADEDGTSYYFRGNVTNNYVKFGKFPEVLYRGYASSTAKIYYREYKTLEDCESATANNLNCEVSPNAGKDMWWRIIRINGNGTIRMQYDGTEAHTNGEVSDDRVALLGVKYNNKNDDNKYVGYMYGGAEGVGSSDAAQAQINETPSNMKTELENWYKVVLVNTTYENYISDEVFCNDRSIPKTTTLSGHTQGGYAKEKTAYGGRVRAYETHIPTFRCDMNNIINTKNDKFTVSTEKGNGKLTYPVGLITVDEVMTAGGSNTSNEKYYLNKGRPYRSLSPSLYNTSNVSTLGLSNTGGMAIPILSAPIMGVAPVINLNAEVSKTLKGTGTMIDPYTIE